MSLKQKKLVVIDGNALLHRAWHAIPYLATKEGFLVNAVYGFLLIFFKMFKELKPDYVAVTFDVAKKTFRHEQFAAYKAKRQKQPDELYAQLPILKDILRLFNIQVYEKEGFEADDLIGTICFHPEVNKKDVLSVIVTGDLDTLQLIDDNTQVYTLKKGVSETIVYTVKEVQEKFDGLVPSQMVDFKGLRGDVSDNISGIKGIGEKTAIFLLKNFHNLEQLYQTLETDPYELKDAGVSPKIIKLLQEHKEDAFFSKRLATIDKAVPFEFHLKDCLVGPYDRAAVVQILQKFEFKSLLNKLPEIKQPVTDKNKLTQGLLFHQEQASQNKNYIMVETDGAFEKFITKAEKAKELVFDTETSDLNPYEAKLLGISFCFQEGVAYYVIYKEQWLPKLRKLLENEAIAKIGHNLKYDIAILENLGIKTKPLFFDTMVASYLLNPGKRAHNLDSLAFSEFAYEKIPIESLIGTGKNQISMEAVPVKNIAQYSCEDADYTFRLAKKFKQQLQDINCLGLMQKIEMPLVPVLEQMERQGVLIDVTFLKSLSKKVTKQLEAVDKEIYKIAGTVFNINSPLQLKEILFTKMGLSSQGLHKTKTGISTSAADLERIKGTHPVVDLIIKHRELAKLKSTYIEALPKLVNSQGRIHTSFNQTVTTTGRLSSSEPNLQNIPIRTELGNEIRKSFIAPAGYKIVSADYSQIELRIIASLAQDENMMECFQKGEDIHKATAAKIFKTNLAEVSYEQRRAAKAVNFGVIYGMGIGGLAEAVGISRQEAKHFIEQYFNVYQKVKQFLEETKQMARDRGFVETLFGRRRYIPEINSGVQVIRSAAERMAINAPIQGTAADLIKLAMIKVAEALPKTFPKAKMLLQVHDELVFEVPSSEIQAFAEFIKKIMNNVYELRVPIETEVESGDSWGEMSEVK